MTSVSVEAAKNSCVPQEQNELVVQTGLTFQIPKLKVESLKRKCVYLIGDTEVIETFGKAFSAKVNECVNDDVSESYTNNSITVCRRTILDIPQEWRSRAIIICFDEPSYNGRQCLYHLFGGDIKELSQCKGKPYQAFSELIDRVQNENSCGIVFVPKALQSDTLKPVMWCPKTIEEPPRVHKGIFPRKDVESIYGKRDKMVKTALKIFEDDIYVYAIDGLPVSMQTWVNTFYPGTAYVGLGTDDNITYNFWGWKEMPTVSSYKRAGRDWQTTFQLLPDEPKFPKAEIAHFKSTHVTGYDVVSIPPIMQSWVRTNYPNTNFVKLDSEDGIRYTFRGWNKAPTSIHRRCPDWETTVQVLPDEPKKVVEPPRFPRKDVEAVISFRPTYPTSFVYPVENLSESMKVWVQTQYPETKYVQMAHSHSTTNGMMFVMWGWNHLQTKYDTTTADWSTPFESVNDASVPVVTAAPTATPTDPVLTQLAALTDAITALTKLVAELPR